MRGEVRSIEANDIRDWPRWRSAGVAEECQWFTVTVGSPGGKGGDLFQVCVASVAWLREHRRGEFVGLPVDRFDASSITRAIEQRVSAAEAPTWEQLALALALEMRWEYAGHARPLAGGQPTVSTFASDVMRLNRQNGRHRL